MSQVVIGDILPYTQATATLNQTVFGTNWTANAASDVVVYQTPAGSGPNDLTQILAYPATYSVAFIGALQQVQVTLVTGAGAGDIITITRQTPADRMNLYSNTNFVPSMLNNDFGILTLVDQQAQLVNQLIGPRYNYSAIITDVVDTILPLLGANQAWVKNGSNTAIIPLNVPAGGIAPANATFVTENDQTSILPNSFRLVAGTNVTLTTGSNTLTVSVTGQTIIGGSQNDLAYYAANGTVLSPLATANNGVLVTSSGGVPSISSTLPSGLTIPGYAHSGANSDITSLLGLTGPLQAPSSVNDSSGKQLINFSYATLPVNYLQIRNGATGDGPQLNALGTDGSIPLNLGITNSSVNVYDTSATVGGQIRFYNALFTNYTGLKVADSSATSVIFTLPSADGTNHQFLQTNGSGVLSFASASSVGAALTEVDDTNVTMTLGGAPTTAVLTATSMTLGWTGQLSVARGGTALASLTAHNLIVGNGTGTPNLLAPSATSGIPIISQGSSANPVYGTAVVAGGGTGDTSFTAYGVLTGGTTSTGVLQAVTPGASGTIFQSGSSSALPTWSTATYPSTAGTQYNVLQSTGTNITSATLSSVIDGAIGSTQGDILYRNASGWVVLAPSTAGFVLKTGGAAANPSWTNISGVSVAPTVQKFTSGSGTYTTPAGVLYLRVKAIGGGSGGGGSGNTSGNAGSGGTDTTFGSSLITASGANGGANAVIPGAGGGAAATGLSATLMVGGTGQGAITITPTGYFSGGQGAGGPLGGCGGGGPGGVAGSNASANSGAGGGGGAGQPEATGMQIGCGGSAGGYVEALITSPSATYAYAVGPGGAGGVAGTNGTAGGNGGSGYIEVWEYYQ